MNDDIGVNKVNTYFKFKRQRYKTWVRAVEPWKHFLNGNMLILY